MPLRPGITPALHRDYRYPLLLSDRLTARTDTHAHADFDAHVDRDPEGLSQHCKIGAATADTADSSERGFYFTRCTYFGPAGVWLYRQVDTRAHTDAHMNLRATDLCADPHCHCITGCLSKYSQV